MRECDDFGYYPAAADVVASIVTAWGPATYSSPPPTQCHFSLLLFDEPTILIHLLLPVSKFFTLHNYV